MKIRNYKLCLLITLLVLGSFKIFAVPAYPYPIKYKQPDGSEITVQLKGDERVHWGETTDGYTLLSNGKNGWEYAITDENGDLKASGVIAREVGKRTLNELTFLKGVSKKSRFSTKQANTLKAVWEAKYGSDKLIGSGEILKKSIDKTSVNDGRRKVFTPTGTKKLIMILIEYTDVKFTKTRQNFVDLMNTQDYNLNGAQGCVRQYFYEMSYGQFNVETDVAPNIYTADYDMAYYGAPNGSSHDIRANDLMKEAIQKADPDVDYTIYDNDGDGSIDGIYIIYAGYGEATGGGVNTIWPHAGGVTGTYDGKTASKYSCSNELNSDGSLTSIGVICHEFGHVCGAPDYYDTDYSTGGQFPGTGKWDLMDTGCYNGAKSGSKPAHFNPFEKIRAGWLTPITLSSPTEITEMPDITYYPVVYKFSTTTNNEYYLMENRQNTGFNTYCPGHGLMIYHYSETYWNISSNKTAPQGFYPVCASATTSPAVTSDATAYGSINSGGCPFPGTSSKTSFTDDTTPTAKSWAGNNTLKPLTYISENNTNKTISFNFMNANSCTPPTIQATNLSFTDIQDNQVTLNWTRGNGDKVIILAKRNESVSTTPLSGNQFTANNSFGVGFQIDAGTYVVYDGSSNSVTITDLLKNSTYYFSVFEYNDGDFCYLSPALTGNVSTTGCSPCVPSTTNYSFGIKNVTFNTINNSSLSSTGYSNYSEIQTQVNPGSTYTLSVQTDSYTNTIYTKAWIDWNNDCTFQSEEEYDLGSSTNDATVTKSITVPMNVKSGFVTMRVRGRIGSAPLSCGNHTYSEAEDYTLKITGGCTPPTVQASNLTASDIQADQITLNWTRGNGTKVLVIAKQVVAVDAYLIGLSNFTANAEFSSGTQIGNGNYIVYNGTNNNVTVTGLIPGTTYYFAVYEYNTPDNCILLSALTGNSTTSAGSSYCTPTITNAWFGFTNVSFNTINNTSLATQGYVNNSNIMTKVVKGQTYTLSAIVYTGGYPMYTKAWIDWNNDGTLSTSTEEYDLGSSSTTGPTLISPSITVPATAKDGVVKLRLNTKYSSYTIPCGTINYGESEDYSILVSSPSTIWDGLTWNNGTPSSLNNVVIDGEYNDAGFTCNNLTVNAGKQLTISSGTLTVNGNILLHNDESGTATFVNYGTVNTNIKGTVEQYLATTRNWYVSSPVNGAIVPLGYTCYLYREPSDNTGYKSPATKSWKSVSAGESFTTGLGYIALPANDGLTMTFSTGSTGHLNDGEISIPLSRTIGAEKPGFNLIGNPYPSYLNVMPAIEANAALSKTVWYRTRSTSTSPAYYFETVNTTTGIGTDNAETGTVTGYIPPMQGFWVKANSATSLVLNNTYRYHSNAEGVTTTPLKVLQKNADEQKIIRLRVSNGTYGDETIIVFNQNAHNGLDKFDSEKMTNNNRDIPEIYTATDGKELVINGMNTFDASLEIPVGFRTAKAGSFTIQTTEINNFDENTNIYLRNNITGETQLISDQSTYTFNTPVTETDAMFSIIFRAPGSTTFRDNYYLNGVHLSSNEQRQIVVNLSSNATVNHLKVYNATGQLLTNKKLSESVTFIDVPAPGVYLVAVGESVQNVIVK